MIKWIGSLLFMVALPAIAVPLVNDTALQSLSVAGDEPAGTQLTLTTNGGEDLVGCNNLVIVRSSDFAEDSLTYDLLYTALMTAYADTNSTLDVVGELVDGQCVASQLTLQ